MHIYLRGTFLQRLRLVSGLILFAFAATHFLNHALGLVSLEVMHQAQQLRTSVTRSAPGTVILLLALVTHIALALYKLARRETWVMPRWEAVQIGLGLAIPFLLLPHIVNTRIAHVFFNVDDNYLYELVRLWPDSAFVQSSLLLLVWGHSCLGLHYWLRLSDNYIRIAPVLAVFAIAIPVLALAGFAVAGRATGDIMSDPQALAVLKARSNWPNAEDSAALAWMRTGTRIGFLAILATVALIFTSRRMLHLIHKPNVQISYVDGPTIQLSPGATLLEASRSAKIPHASLCGGRGRCSTCRVRVVQGLDRLPAPVDAEAITLQSIEAPPNIRLACQIKPSAHLTVAIVSHPATPGPPQTDFLEIKEIVAAHVRAVLDSREVEFESSDPIAVSRWAEQKTTAAVPVRNLTSRGFSLQGARLDYLLNRPAIALVYARQAHAISLFVLPNSGAHSVAMRGQRSTYRVLAWTDAGLDYLAVSDLPARELDRLEVALLETASMSEMVS